MWFGFLLYFDLYKKNSLNNMFLWCLILELVLGGIEPTLIVYYFIGIV